MHRSIDMALPHTTSAVHLQLCSRFEMLDLVQLVSDHLGRMLKLEEDTVVWMEVAIRESVINAIKHGNRHDASKHVFVDFEFGPTEAPAQLEIRIRDQGAGFDPA
jgi:serine/threonine-protein kinase RsbW